MIQNVRCGVPLRNKELGPNQKPLQKSTGCIR